MNTFLAGSLVKFVRRFLKALDAARFSPGRVEVHALSIALRRCLAADWLVRNLYGVKLLRKNKWGLTVLRKSVAHVRDCQEIPLRFQALDLASPLAGDFLTSLAHRNENAVQALVAEMAAFDDSCLNKLKDKKTVLKLLRASGPDSLKKLRRHLLQQVLDHASSAIDEADNKSLHRMRVRYKYYRYVIELLSPDFTGMEKKGLKHLKSLQDAMGDAHDFVVLEEWFAEFSGSMNDDDAAACRKVIDAKSREVHDAAREYVAKHLPAIQKSEGQ